MGVYLVHQFRRWAVRHHVKDDVLCDAVAEMSSGLVDADLGGGLMKKRLPRRGHGKRGSFRSLVGWRRGSHWYFLHGYAKNDLSNVNHDEEVACRRRASDLLAQTAETLDRRLTLGELFEVKCDAKT